MGCKMLTFAALIVFYNPTSYAMEELYSGGKQLSSLEMPLLEQSSPKHRLTSITDQLEVEINNGNLSPEDLQRLRLVLEKQQDLSPNPGSFARKSPAPRPQLMQDEREQQQKECCTSEECAQCCYCCCAVFAEVAADSQRRDHRCEHR